MRWENIRKQYPDRFVLIEALKATSNNRIRKIEEMAIVEDYSDSKTAWNGYKVHHKQNPDREFYIFHTSQENIEVVEEYFTGVRGRI